MRKYQNHTMKSKNQSSIDTRIQAQLIQGSSADAGDGADQKSFLRIVRLMIIHYPASELP